MNCGLLIEYTTLTLTYSQMYYTHFCLLRYQLPQLGKSAGYRKENIYTNFTFNIDHIAKIHKELKKKKNPEHQGNNPI